VKRVVPLTAIVPVLLLSLSAGAAGTEYKCSTKFGQTIPIRLSVATKNQPAVITELNPEVEKLSSVKTALKKRDFKFEDQTIVLETRYATREGPNFTFKLSCKHDDCEGSLPAPKIRLDTEVFDKRPESRAGWAEIQFTKRSRLNLLVRLFRESPALSGSGELKFFKEDERFMLDTGIDEQLELVKGFRTRLAALEITIDCQKLKAAKTAR
jgi:hypothetical protein